MTQLKTYKVKFEQCFCQGCWEEVVLVRGDCVSVEQAALLLKHVYQTHHFSPVLNTFKAVNPQPWFLEVNKHFFSLSVTVIV